MTASTGTGNGTLGLNLVDNDSIRDGSTNPLGWPGRGQRQFHSARSTPLIRRRRALTINQAAGQTDPTSASPINFTVIFSETVTGFAASAHQFCEQHGERHAHSGGDGDQPDVQRGSVGMTGTSTVVASVLAGAATDAGSNSSLVSTSTDNTVTVYCDRRSDGAFHQSDRRYADKCDELVVYGHVQQERDGGGRRATLRLCRVA